MKISLVQMLLFRIPNLPSLVPHSYALLVHPSFQPLHAAAVSHYPTVGPSLTCVRAGAVAGEGTSTTVPDVVTWTGGASKTTLFVLIWRCARAASRSFASRPARPGGGEEALEEASYAIKPSNNRTIRPRPPIDQAWRHAYGFDVLLLGEAQVVRDLGQHAQAVGAATHILLRLNVRRVGDEGCVVSNLVAYARA